MNLLNVNGRQLNGRDLYEPLFKTEHAITPTPDILARTKTHADQVQVWPDGTRLVHTYDPNRMLGDQCWAVVTLPDGTQKAMKSPLVLDLDGNGVRTSARPSRYDVDGDGSADLVDSISRGDALLAFDSDKDGLAGEDGRELLGDSSDVDGDGRPDGYKDGFEALEALVRRAAAEGLLDARTADDGRLEAEDLAALGRRYGLSLKRGFGARPESLAGLEIVSLDLGRGAPVLERDFDGRGNALSRRAGAGFGRADGSRGAYADLWLESREPPPDAAGMPRPISPVSLLSR